MNYGELKTEGLKQVGMGKVYWGKVIDEVLKAENIAPDVIVPEGLPIQLDSPPNRTMPIFIL